MGAAASILTTCHNLPNDLAVANLNIECHGNQLPYVRRLVECTIEGMMEEELGRGLDCASR
jgi:hypothetical protein